MFNKLKEILFKNAKKSTQSIQINYEKKKALTDHVTYPDFQYLNVLVDERPKCHWASLFQLIEKIDGSSNESIPKETWLACDKYGKNVCLYIYKENSESSFSTQVLEPGKTISILYPELISGNAILINAKNYDFCYVFNAPLNVVYEEADKILKAADAKHKAELIECFGCDKKVFEAEMMNADCCKLAYFCSEVGFLF